jgi:hypothetical protein
VQVALRSAPMPLHDGHSFQSESSIALRFVPLHRSPLIVFPQRRLMRVGLYPALPHSVQDVTGTGRFKDISAPSRAIARKHLHKDSSTLLLACRRSAKQEDRVESSFAQMSQLRTYYERGIRSSCRVRAPTQRRGYERDYCK